MSSAGYSGKPLWAKLGLKPGQRVEVIAAPTDYSELTGLDTAALDFPAHGALDLVHGFVTTRAALDALLDRGEQRLVERGVLWVSWPKRSANVASELTEDTVRELALPRGWVDTKVCAVDATWSGLKLGPVNAIRVGRAGPEGVRGKEEGGRVCRYATER